jgi:hypothetical protein
MKRSLPFFLLLSTLFVAAPLAAKDSGPPQFNTIVVKLFSNANGMTQSQDFISMFADNLRTTLVKEKMATLVVEEGTVVPDAAAANSIVVEGKFLSHESGGFITPGKLGVEVSIYRLSDHALVKTWDTTAYFPTNGDHKDKVYAYYTGMSTGQQVWVGLKGISLSTIPPAAPGSSPAAPGAASAPAPGVAPAGPDAVASVQLSSDPAGAEITIDGNYVGSTPSTVNLKPGTHSIKMTINGYMTWVRSIETQAGESRSFAANLEKTNP